MAGAIHTTHDVETTRAVRFVTFSDTASASFEVRTLALFGEVARRAALRPLDLEPFAGVAHVETTTDAFRERGGAAALALPEGTTRTTYTTVGLRAFATVELPLPTTAYAAIGWRHAFGDTTPATRPTIGGQGFGTAGAPIARDAAVLGAGFEAALGGGAAIAVDYTATLDDRAAEHGPSARLRVAFREARRGTGARTFVRAALRRRAPGSRTRPSRRAGRRTAAGARPRRSRPARRARPCGSPGRTPRRSCG